jgi:hypothetical protein
MQTQNREELTMDIRSKLKLRGDQGKPAEGDPRLRFQKRNQEVLDQTFENRGKRSKGTGMGKSIWDKEKLEKYGIEEFYCLKNGSYFVEVLPLSFDPGVSYSKELCVHFQVGFSGDHFLCLHRYNGSKCYRCEEQAKLYRQIPRVPGQKPPDKIKALYPNDRMGYLVWDRTAELLNGESPSPIIQVWNMPKKMVHEEIQSRVRDKITRHLLDISDMNPGGDGRTVSFEVAMEGPFPKYKGFDLTPRPSPIPPEIAEKLVALIEESTKLGFKTAIDYLLHVPTYEEVKTSMLTETDDQDENREKTPLDVPKGEEDKSPRPTPPAQNMNQEEITQMLVTKYENLQAKLTGMNAIQWMMWLKGEGKEYADSIKDTPKDQAIQLIVEALLEEDCLKHGITL